jgi:CP family cyanate transporter-like MFS transporter
MTLPLVILAMTTPLIVTVARRFGVERVLAAGLAMIVFGTIIRSSGSIAALFAGTAIIGLGVAAASVLLPGLMKKHLPKDIAAVTCAYSLIAGVLAATVSSVVVPIAAMPWASWPGALCATLPVSAAAFLFWGSRKHEAGSSMVPANLVHCGRVWRSALGWQVSLFYGLNSMIYNAMANWLPSMLLGFGFSNSSAGILHGLIQLTTALPALTMASLTNRVRDLRHLCIVTVVLTLGALLGLLTCPGLAMVWVAILGLGLGSTMLLSLTLIGLRAADADQASALSGMSQSIGYLLAALAAPMMGILHDVTGG